MNNEYITIANKQYYTTKEQINSICLNCGFDSVTYKTESIKGKFRKGYSNATFKNSFRCFADKLRASNNVSNELNKLEVV